MAGVPYPLQPLTHPYFILRCSFPSSRGRLAMTDAQLRCALFPAVLLALTIFLIVQANAPLVPISKPRARLLASPTELAAGVATG